MNNKLTIVGEELYLTTIDDDGSWSCRSLGPIDDVRPEDVPDDAVLDATGLPDQALIHAEALEFNFGSKPRARELRAIIDARLERRPQRRYGLAEGQLATHLEVGRWIDKVEAPK